MVWPIGQTNGPAYRLARRSRAIWAQVLEKTGLWSRPCGSLHLAYRTDELAVLEEFASVAPELGYACELLPPQAARQKSPAARRDGLLGALWSEHEMNVDPREVVGRLPAMLREQYGVELFYGVAIAKASSGWLTSTSGDRWNADRIVVAAGADCRTLYPEIYRSAGFRRCKLQMLRTVAQPQGWQLGPMLAGGLTLRHYEAFSVCPSLSAVKRRIAQETPELDHFGIHVMASQNSAGEVVLGDSHEYDDDIAPFDKCLIDDLMLRELREMIELPDWTIAQRWHGIYVKTPETSQFLAEPEPNVHVAIASGGAGMTLSFGWADALWSRWQGEGVVGDASRSDASARDASPVVPSPNASPTPKIVAG